MNALPHTTIVRLVVDACAIIDIALQVPSSTRLPANALMKTLRGKLMEKLLLSRMEI